MDDDRRKRLEEYSDGKIRKWLITIAVCFVIIAAIIAAIWINLQTVIDTLLTNS